MLSKLVSADICLLLLGLLYDTVCSLIVDFFIFNTYYKILFLKIKYYFRDSVTSVFSR